MAGLIAQARTAVKQDDVDRVVIAAKKILAQFGSQILSMMREVNDPVKALAQATLFVLKQIYDKSQGAIPMQALGPAGKEIMADLARIGEAGGLFKASPDIIRRATIMAVQLFVQLTKTKPATAPQATQAPAAPQAPQGTPQPPMGAI